MGLGFKAALDAVPNGQWKILITDHHSQELLDQVYTNFEILQQNVTCELLGRSVPRHQVREGTS